MEFIRKNKKNILIIVLFILFIVACMIIFYLLNKNNNQVATITGKVIIADTNYVIIENGDNNYLITNIKGNYVTNDKVEFTYKNKDYNDKDDPITIKISDENLLSREELKEEKKQTIEESKKIIKEENIEETKQEDINNEETIVTPKNNVIEDNNSESNADTEVISYLEELENEIDNATIKDSLKNGFITIVDFIFYEGEIKGYTFNELSDSAKLKVLEIAMYFDNKIDKYFPGYKESISNTTSKVYDNVKETIVSTYLDLTTTICDYNEELCISAKNGFQKLKTNFGLTFNLIKEIATDGVNNLKDWYEIYSGK